MTVMNRTHPHGPVTDWYRLFQQNINGILINNTVINNDLKRLSLAREMALGQCPYKIVKQNYRFMYFCPSALCICYFF